MIYSYPDSPEAVALSLFEHIIKQHGEDQRRNEREMLDLYAQCLVAVNGERVKPNLTLVR